MVERLDEGVNVSVQLSPGAFEDEVERGFEAGLAEGAVAVVGQGDLVEIPENVLEPAEAIRACIGCERLGLTYYLPFELDVCLKFVGSQKAVGREGGIGPEKEGHRSCEGGLHFAV